MKKEKFEAGDEVIFNDQPGVVTEYLPEEKQVAVRLESGQVVFTSEENVKPAPKERDRPVTKQIEGPKAS